MLLAIETATDVCSVSVLDHGEPVTVMEVLRPRAHGEWLATLIKQSIDAAGAGVATALRAVGVSAGPGSYTGLRIGVSTAKGLCSATGADLIGVPTLEGLALGAAGLAGLGDLIVPALRSRRGEIYVGGFEPTVAGLKTVRPATALELDQLKNWLPRTDGVAWVVGEAASDLLAAIDVSGRVREIDPSLVRPSAVHIGRIAWQRYGEGAVDDLSSFEPSYLKPFEGKRARSIFERPSPKDNAA